MRICASCGRQFNDAESWGKYMPPHFLNIASPGWYCFDCTEECEGCNQRLPWEEISIFDPGICEACRIATS